MSEPSGTADAALRALGQARPVEHAPDAGSAECQACVTEAVSLDFAVADHIPPGELLRAFAEVAPFPILISREQDGKIVFCNGKLGELLGVSPAELLGRCTLDFYHDPTERESVLAELRSRGRVSEREVQIATRRGRTAWAIFTIVPLTIAGESLLFSALYDVTRRRETEDRLQQSEARFRGFVENSSDLIFALDRQAALTYLSPNVSRILGYGPGQLLGQTFDALVHANDLPKLWETTELTRDTGQVLPSFEFRMRHKDGSTRWFCTTLVPIPNATGQVVSLTGTAHDITPEKNAIQELECVNRSLRDAQLQLVRTEKMASLGLLMAGIAHEIRTPLGAVNNTQRTLAQALDKLGERLHEAFPEAVADSKLGRLLKVLADSSRVVADGSTRMTDIVQRLRKFSCAEEAKLCPVDVNAIAEDTLALIHHELRHCVSIERRYGEGVTLMGYPARLNQVLVNLLVNAAQAVRARGNGHITLETRAVGDQVEIRISDDGVGIPPEHL
ncbi:MAG TPA: PAS domain S-box protein, partial [Polyangiaceae bacterium]|nr:PAS domain S-box protein [Polyangiaceae bacterium]